jgi:hypothetical protein
MTRKILFTFVKAKTIIITLDRVGDSFHWPISCCSRPWSRINIDLTWWISWDGEFMGHGNIWGTDSESKGKDSTYEHGSFVLGTPYEPCLHHASPESAMLSARSTHEDYNSLMALSSKKFRRMVVDVYVYHKHCRFRVCIVALTLQLNLQWYINN